MTPRSTRVRLSLTRRNGRRVLKVVLPGWVLAAGLVGGAIGVGLVATSVSSVYSDYLTLRSQRASLSAMLPRAADQQALIESYQAQAREVLAEIGRWRDIHARILEPFGPGAKGAKQGAGTGGGAIASAGASGTLPAGEATLQEDMARLSDAVKEEGESLRGLEQFLTRAGKVLASLPSRWPIRGPINSDFGFRLSPWGRSAEEHSGIDIGAPIGTPVMAPAPGTVVFAGRQAEYGIAVIIDHGSETRSLYGHLSKLIVASDQKVRRGDLLALTGNTGRSSGPHLHYEIQVNGQAVNPTTYLWD